MECNPCKCTWELTLDLSISQYTISCPLKKIRKASKLEVWFPYTLNEKNKEDCISIVTSLLSRQRNDLFIKNIITVDEKRVLHYNIQCQRLWRDKDESLQPTSKVELHKRKVMLCVWWGSLQYYSFWVFKKQSDTKCRHTQLQCVHKISSEKDPKLSIETRFLLIM